AEAAAVTITPLVKETRFLLSPSLSHAFPACPKFHTDTIAINVFNGASFSRSLLLRGSSRPACWLLRGGNAGAGAIAGRGCNSGIARPYPGCVKLRTGGASGLGTTRRCGIPALICEASGLRAG